MSPAYAWPIPGIGDHRHKVVGQDEGRGETREGGDELASMLHVALWAGLLTALMEPGVPMQLAGQCQSRGHILPLLQ